MTYKPSKLGQTNLVFGLHQSPSVSLCMRDYKITFSDYDLWYPGLHTDRQTHTDRLHTDTQLL